MLQIVEVAERSGALADIERDILLEELRKAYAELKFGDKECAELSEVAATPIVPVAPQEVANEEGEEEVEPEVEVELLFDESEDNEPEIAADEPTADEPTADEPVAEELPTESTPIAEQTPIVEAEPVVEPLPSAVEDEIGILAEKSKNRDALLSLYDDEPKPILGETFHEAPSVADVIACPKGVAESAPVLSLGGAIGLADKFMLVRELFDGDNSAYESAISALDAQPSFDDCLIYIAEHYAWSPNSEGTKYMMELLQRKYN